MLDLTTLNPQERLLAEQAILNFRLLNTACDAAADGTVLAIAEQLAMQQGRELIRQTLQASLEQQVQATEKKGLGSEPVSADVGNLTTDAKRDS